MKHERSAWRRAEGAFPHASGERGKKRPVVVVQADVYNHRLRHAVVIDPERQAVVVHQLTGDRYSVHGEFGRGQVAISALLAGFGVDVGSVFASAESIPE